MIKDLIRKLFFKIYKFDYRRTNKSQLYNRYGLVIPKNTRGSARYIATPVSINRKCLRKSIDRYGITPQDSGETAIMKALAVHLVEIKMEHDIVDN